MFDRNLFKKEKEIEFQVALSANLLRDKGKHVKGTITIAHCKGHDCIMFFYFKDFHENHRDYFLETFFIGKLKKNDLLFFEQ